MIRLENVSKSYKIDEETAFFALKDATLEVKEKEFISIIGPSGSGKSTLMHLIGLLDKPSKGEIIIQNKKISKLDDDQISTLRNEFVGFVFQQFNLIPKLTVLENILLPTIYARKKIDYDPTDKAIDLLKKEAPEAKVRFVNVLELSPNTVGQQNKIAEVDFEKYFTKDKPVIFNFHGYADTLEKTIFRFENALDRISIHGYMESGSTTTPLDLHIRNKTDRYNLFIEAVEKMAKAGVVTQDKATKLVSTYKQKIKDHKDYIIRVGDDPEEISKWQWKSKNKV